MLKKIFPIIMLITLTLSACGGAETAPPEPIATSAPTMTIDEAVAATLTGDDALSYDDQIAAAVLAAQNTQTPTPELPPVSDDPFTVEVTVNGAKNTVNWSIDETGRFYMDETLMSDIANGKSVSMKITAIKSCSLIINDGAQNPRFTPFLKESQYFIFTATDANESSGSSFYCGLQRDHEAQNESSAPFLVEVTVNGLENTTNWFIDNNDRFYMDNDLMNAVASGQVVTMKIIATKPCNLIINDGAQNPRFKKTIDPNGPVTYFVLSALDANESSGTSFYCEN